MMTMCCYKEGLIVLQVEMLSLSMKRYVSSFIANETKKTESDVMHIFHCSLLLILTIEIYFSYQRRSEQK